MKKPFVPTPEQSKAVDPEHSVWVTANAGSGKTHVLVERVIRLLLNGAAPASILCITFTKAAAAEMSARLYARLGSWTALDDSSLTDELQRIGLQHVDAIQRITARRLFARALETPGGLKIQTIHAFCERTLQLFPVESGVSPGFRIIDDRGNQEIQLKAKNEILRLAKDGVDGSLATALSTVVEYCSSDGFAELLQNFTHAAHGLRKLLAADINQAQFELLLKKSTSVDLEETQTTLLRKINNIDIKAYSHHAEILEKFGPFRKHSPASLMQKAIRTEDKFEILKHIYFTRDTKLKPRESLMSVAAAKQYPQTKDFTVAEQARLILLFTQHDLLIRIEATSALFQLAKAVMNRVETLKKAQGLYDFDDLIERTSHLLRDRRATQWVLYKLDSSLQHILLDEAQDTSPAQWHIIQSLYEEFFAGSGQPQNLNRTVFVVGDRKQSIYSFQGADTRVFELARQEFLTRINDKKNDSNEIDLSISYRSCREILDAVNRVFPAKNPQFLGLPAVDSKDRDHTTNRGSEIGRVEVWPLVLHEDDAEKADHWKAPLDREAARSPKRRLAQKIAATIMSWIGGRWLASQNRMIEPGDILILLQSRGTLFSMLIAELRKIGVPVAGADRLKLSQSLVVQDLIVLGQWLLLPIDDYALACILKSPFVPEPLDEDQLFDLAYNRSPKSLWTKLEEKPCANSVWLNHLMNLSKTKGPFALFSDVLSKFRGAMLGRLGPEAGDATDALLDLALAYESEQGLSLMGFLQWVSSSETEIKRELENTSGEVRLITVHGAKGLESNIVFLPDAASVPKGRTARDLLMLPKISPTYELPLWMLPGLSVSPQLQNWIDEETNRSRAERNRLLYVAMTRARDELYICGAKSANRDVPKDSWYAIVEPILGVTENTSEVLHQRVKKKDHDQSKIHLPTWVKQVADSVSINHPEDSFPTASPSSFKQSNFDLKVAQHGIRVHQFLQKLIDQDPKTYVDFTQKHATKFGLDESEASRIASLFGTPELAPFISKDGRSEIELRGIIGDTPITARVDRVIILPGEILLLDYKTDAHPVRLAPNHDYAIQMALYQLLLETAYPDRIVKPALLWTQTGKIEWLDQKLLAQAREQALSNLEGNVS